MATDTSASRIVLGWLDASERDICPACGERARVELPALSASVCLACGASSVEGTERAA